MWRIVARLRTRARSIPARSPLTKVTPALCMATSVTAFTSESADHGVLLLRQHFRLDIDDAKSCSHCLRGDAIVAGQHDDTDAVRTQLRERSRCGGLDRVGDRDDAAGAPAHSQ